MRDHTYQLGLETIKLKALIGKDMSVIFTDSSSRHLFKAIDSNDGNSGLLPDCFSDVVMYIA